MIKCQKCGNDNQLGRVFCGKCGSKLELTAITSETVAEMEHESWIKKHWWKLLILVVVIVLGVGGLAFWPDSALIGAKGTPGGSKKVEINLKALKGLKTGQGLGPVFREADINGYFEYIMAKKTGIGSMRVVLLPSVLRLKVVNTLFSQKIGDFTFAPKVSYEIQCVAMGTGLAVRKVKQGHLPMVGPLRGMTVRKIYGVFAAQEDWSAFSGLTEVRIEEGQITPMVVKK